LNNFIFDVLTDGPLYESTFRLAAILAFAAAGEWVAERAGTINISIEAMLLGGHFGAAIAFTASLNFGMAIVVGGLAGMAIAALQAWLSHFLTADQFGIGLTLNILLLGLAAFLQPSFDLNTRLAGVLSIPLLSQIPLVGPALFGQRWPMYLIYGLVPLSWWLVARTNWGLEVRAVGEDPQSADVSGIHVNARRRQAILYAGLLSGIGGAVYLFGQVGRFESSNIGGKGIIAIAAVIFGGWTLRGAVAGCLLFGYVDALRLNLPTILGYSLNSQLLASLPFLATVIVMMLFAKLTRQPVALARPFVRGLK
jgi:simple sugar transport system permease protein